MFNQEEMELLNTGMKHSIEQPLNHYWNDLIIETEQAIKKLEPKTQEVYRIIAIVIVIFRNIAQLREIYTYKDLQYVITNLVYPKLLQF